MCHYILLIYLDLGPEDTWVEAENTWISVVKLGRMKGEGGSSFFHKSVPYDVSR